MSNRRRPRVGPEPSRTSPTGPQVTTVTKVKSPADIVAIVPYLLGFDPADSLVMVALEGARQRFGPCARLDLVDPADLPDDVDLPDAIDHQVDYVRDLVAQHGFDSVILVAYSAIPPVADAVVTGLVGALRRDGVEVVEAVRADGEHYWSYVCDDPVCCPAVGTPYDVSASQVAAEAVVAGLARAPSRDSLRAQFEPSPALRTAFDRAAGVALVEAATQPPWTEEQVRRVVRHAVAGGQPLGMDELVPLTQAVQRVSCRDAAWSAMTRADAAEHLAFWSRALRAVPDDLMAPVGSLAAFAAWLSGRGVLASHAAERVLDLHPSYSMAVGVLQLCATSVNPAVWTWDDDDAASTLRS